MPRLGELTAYGHSIFRTRAVNLMAGAEDEGYEYVYDYDMSTRSSPCLRSVPSSRLLQSIGGRNDGPFIVLIIICVVFCFIWAPLVCQRRLRTRQRQRAEVRATELIRSSIEQFRQQWVASGAADAAAAAATNTTNSGGRLPLEERREYIRNVVVSKRVTKIILSASRKTDEVDEDDEDQRTKKNKNEDEGDANDTVTLVVEDLVDVNDTSKHVAAEPCAICLNEYKVSDVLCWSQTTRCNHFFHRDCIEGWLLREEHHGGRNRSACPCCRHNFLSLGDEESDADGDDDRDASNHRFAIMSTNNDDFQFLRGMRLFYMLSQLQQAGSQSNNTNNNSNSSDNGSGNGSVVELSSMARMRQLIQEMETGVQENSGGESHDNHERGDIDDGSVRTDEECAVWIDQNAGAGTPAASDSPSMDSASSTSPIGDDDNAPMLEDSIAIPSGAQDDLEKRVISTGTLPGGA